MVRTLQEPAPTSSVARLLDTNAAERAVQALQPTAHISGRAGEQRTCTEPTQSVCPKPIKREISLTPVADAALERLLHIFRQATGARLTASHVARATFMAMQHAAPEIERVARSIGPTALPSNAPAYEAIRKRFEDRIVQAIVAGMRAAAPPDAV
ncbi:MAG: hypothetical protein U1D55_07380 [Phycisphaerae bacterium]